MFYKIQSKVTRDIYAFGKSLHTTLFLNESHYDVLRLPRDCSRKQIRDSFIKLSKKHHPDRNNSKDAHIKFLKIKEAYNVLSKPLARSEYDLSLANPYMSYNNHQYHQPESYNPTSNRQTYTQAQRNPWDDPTFWANRNKYEYNSREKPYYGIQGINKVSNSAVVSLCILMTLFGVTLQIFAIRNSFTMKREEMVRKSIEYQANLEDTRQRAEENGNEMQMVILEARLLKDPKDDV